MAIKTHSHLDNSQTFGHRKHFNDQTTTDRRIKQGHYAASVWHGFCKSWTLLSATKIYGNHWL